MLNPQYYRSCCARPIRAYSLCCRQHRMVELGISGSVGAAGGQPPAATRLHFYTPSCRVKGWRAYIRVRWRFRRFRAGPQSDSHRHVSSPCSPNPACRFPAPGSPVGSCTSYTDRRAIRACRWSDSPTSSAAATRRPLCIPSRVRRAVEPVHASTTSNLSGSTPSLTHVMLPESLR